MGLLDDIIAYKQQVNNDVSTQSDPNSIAPDAVGSIGIDLIDMLQPYLLDINNFAFTGGSNMPAGGADKDIYLRGTLNAIEIYRNVNGNWQNMGNIPLGITYPDGIITGLRTNIEAYIVTITAGTWAISNVAYSKATQTQLTVEARDANFNRWDLIYANNQNQIVLLKGQATNVPVKPNLPINSIVVDYVYVPVSGAPFLLAGTNTQSIISGAVVKSKTPVADVQKIINWQVDIVPNDTITYAQKHGNSIADIKGFYDAGGGAMAVYTPNYSYTLNNDSSINLLTLTELFAGHIIII